MIDIDHLTHAGAEALAKRLRGYWKQRGHQITTRLELVAENDRATAWAIRSDLVRGLPSVTVTETISEAAA